MAGTTITPFLNSYKPRKDGKCPVAIRVTHIRVKKHYPTGIVALPHEFERALHAKRRNEAEQRLYLKLQSFISKALQIVDELQVFTFGKFEEMYLNNREAGDSLSFGFDKYIQELKDEKRISTAVSYECAKNSIESFREGLKYADVTPSLLRKYENWMAAQGNSSTTVGIYLRSLRAIFNRASIDRALYPFGEGKGKYSIPKGKNIKKAMSLPEIAKVFRYKPAPGSTEEKARDYWVFLYLCNGMNVKDFCLLKRSNIDGDILTFKREKTKRSKKDLMSVVVSLKPEAKEIIRKWGVPSIAPDAYLFPHLHKGMGEDQLYRVVQDLTKLINKYMKQIAKELEINKPITTYFARHSFATVLKNSGASVEFISEALAHSSVTTTASYLAGFEQEAIHKTTDALLNFGS